MITPIAIMPLRVHIISRSHIVEGGDAVEGFALQKFEGGAAASGDVGHFAGEPEAGDGFGGGAASDDRDGVGLGEHLVDGLGAAMEGRRMNAPMMSANGNPAGRLAISTFSATERPSGRLAGRRPPAARGAQRRGHRPGG